MPLTTVTALALAKNADGLEISQGAGEAIDTADEMQVLFPKEGKLAIIIDSDNSLTQPIFRAGGGSVEGGGTKGFLAKGIGSFTPTAIATGTMQIFIISSDRFKSMDGFIYVGWVASSAGFVRFITLPE